MQTVGEEPPVEEASVALEEPSARRLAGIDVARAFAIIGMVTVHISPSGDASPLTYLLAVPRGRSAILFGVLAGVGVSLLVSSRSNSIRDARMTLVWRAAVLLPIGLWLQTLDHLVLVILADYALLYLFALMACRLADRWLLATAGLSATVGSLIYLGGVLSAPGRFNRQPAEWGDPLWVTLDRLILSGPYPLITWAAPFCVGLWLGRRPLGHPMVQRRLALFGGAVALLMPAVTWLLTRIPASGVPDSWRRLVDDVPHGQMPLWLVSATAAALAVLGISLVLADRFPAQVAPLAAAGRLAFSWYVAHLLVLHAAPFLLRTGSDVGTVLVMLAFTAVVGAISMAWLRFASRGPLELLLQPPWRAGGRTTSAEASGP